MFICLYVRTYICSCIVYIFRKILLPTLKWHKFSSAHDKASSSEFIKAINDAIQSAKPNTTTKKRIYNHPTQETTRLNMITEEGNFWDRKFGNSCSEVTWHQFQMAFKTEFANGISEYINKDLLFEQLKDTLGGKDKVTRTKFFEVMESNDSELDPENKDTLWKLLLIKPQKLNA